MRRGWGKVWSDVKGKKGGNLCPEEQRCRTAKNSGDNADGRRCSTQKKGKQTFQKRNEKNHLESLYGALS